MGSGCGVGLLGPYQLRPGQAVDASADPPHSSMDYTFFDYWAAKLEWEDEDVIEMVATGVEGRAECERATILMMHHKGVREKYSVVAGAIEADAAPERKWVSAPTMHSNLTCRAALF